MRVFRIPDCLRCRYVLMGRNVERDGGLDCWGFFREMRRLHGLPVPPPFVLDSLDEARRVFDEGMFSVDWVRLRRPEPGCLVLFRMGLRDHCGMVLDGCRSFAHLPMRGGARVEALDRQPWAGNILGYFRYSPSGMGDGDGQSD